VTAAEPEIITVEPDYPGWFRPLGRLAEDRPTLALLFLIAAMIGALAIGLGLGAWLL
jgi:ABC-type cobalt transport system substrate-binding protein